MIGWMPLPVQAWLNSSAPNRLPVSVIATAGIAGLARQGGDLVRLDRALAERIGGMDAQMDEIGVGHVPVVAGGDDLGKRLIMPQRMNVAWRTRHAGGARSGDRGLHLTGHRDIDDAAPVAHAF